MEYRAPEEQRAMNESKREEHERINKGRTMNE